MVLLIHSREYRDQGATTDSLVMSTALKSSRASVVLMHAFGAEIPSREQWQVEADELIMVRSLMMRSSRWCIMTMRIPRMLALKVGKEV